MPAADAAVWRVVATPLADMHPTHAASRGGPAPWPAGVAFDVDSLQAPDAVVALLGAPLDALMGRCRALGVALYAPVIRRVVDGRAQSLLRRGLGEAGWRSALGADSALRVEGLAPLTVEELLVDPDRVTLRSGATILQLACSAWGPAFAVALRRRLPRDLLDDDLPASPGGGDEPDAPACDSDDVARARALDILTLGERLAVGSPPRVAA